MLPNDSKMPGDYNSNYQWSESLKSDLTFEFMRQAELLFCINSSVMKLKAIYLAVPFQPKSLKGCSSRFNCYKSGNGEAVTFNINSLEGM